MTTRKIGGHWWVDFRYERKRIRRKSPVNTKRGAADYECVLRQRLLRGEPVDGRKEQEKKMPTFADFSTEFMDVYATTNNKPSERFNKRRVLDLHLLPHFGKMKLDAIGVRHVEAFKAAQLKGGYAAKTINNRLTILRKTLACAHEWELIAAIPKIKWLKVPPPKFDFFVSEEGERLMAAATGQDKVMIIAGLKLGLRRGELMALHWSDVDLKASKVHIRHNVWKGIIGTPKGGGMRTLPMSPQLRRALSGHRHLRGELVFCQDDGSMLTDGQMNPIVGRVCKRARLRHASWHVLRHSFASQLVMKGVPLKVVQELLGHATIDMTMRYAHLAPESRIEAVALLDVG